MRTGFVLLQRSDSKNDVLCCDLVNLSTPCTYPEHLGKTQAVGNLPKQFILFAHGFHTLPVGSLDCFCQCPQHLPQQCECTFACHMVTMPKGVQMPVLGNGLRGTQKRWLPRANASSTYKITWPRALLLFVSEWHQEKRCPCSAQMNYTDRRGRAHLSSNQSLVNGHPTLACSALLLKLLNNICRYLITRVSYH